MAKYSVFVLVVLVVISGCFADTFTNRQTGESFNGYFLQRKRGDKTQVRIEKKSAKYLDLRSYEIERNNLGRKNKIYIISVNDTIDLICETEAFEKAIVLASNQGPQFVLIEIDTAGGQNELARRLCQAIIKTENCMTIAYIHGGKFGGALAQGAIVALACDKVYMSPGTSIGAARAYTQMTYPVKTASVRQDPVEREISNLAWLEYAAAVAKLAGKSELLVKAMVEEDIEVFEVFERGKSVFTGTSPKDQGDKIVRIWSEKDFALTLNVDQAEQLGIADGLALSREEILKQLDVAGAAQVYDKHILRARRKFNKAKQKMDTYLTTIETLGQQAKILMGQIEAIERQIYLSSGSPIIVNDYSTRLGGLYGRNYSRIDIAVSDWDAALATYDNFLDQLQNVLVEQITTYNRAITLAQKHPDLAHHSAGLEENRTLAQAEFTKVNITPRTYNQRF